MEERPDVLELMREIEAEAQRIEAEPPRRSRFVPRMAAPVLSPLLSRLWDVWERDPITSHRGLAGIPIVWLKRATLAVLTPAHRELLRRQRDFNHAVVDELAALRFELNNLRAELAELRPPDSAE
jgi:hypothetical protein